MERARLVNALIAESSIIRMASQGWIRSNVCSQRWYKHINMIIKTALDSKSNVYIMISIVVVVLIAIFMLRLSKKYNFREKVDDKYQHAMITTQL